MKSFLLSVCCISMFLTFSSCSSEIEAGDTQAHNKHTMLCFTNRDAFIEAVKTGQRQTGHYVSYYEMSEDNPNSRNVRSSQETSKVDYSDLVPETEFRNLLNSQGEIQVGDTIYRINSKGTFYAHKKDYESLLIISTRLSPDSIRINENLLRYGNVFHIETFKGQTFDSSYVNVNNAEDDETDASLETRANGWLPEIRFDTFIRVPARRQTIVGKLLQSLIVDNSWTKVFPANKRRRLVCTAFDYNYGLRQSIGIQAKVQKKMWYGGWAKMKNWPEGQLVVGYRNLVLRFDYPNWFNQVSSRIFDNKEKPLVIMEEIKRIDRGFLYPDNIAPYANSIKYYDARNTKFTYKTLLENIHGDYPACFYGLDGIYIYLPSYSATNTNRNDPAEIIKRFSDGGNAIEFGSISYSEGYGTHVNPKPIVVDKTQNQAGEVLGGDFYACCYSQDGNEWIGRILYW